MFHSLLISSCLCSVLVLQATHFLILQGDAETLDREMVLKVEGLIPFQEVELKAEAEDQNEENWSSHATFQANDLGSIDVATAIPLENSSYSTPDVTGLFWSMLPASGEAGFSFKCKDDCFQVDLSLFSKSRLI